jgi:threonine dehydratase
VTVEQLQINAALIDEAAAAIAPYVVRTPTLALDRMAERLGLPVVGKLEPLQHTGAFKVRGAFNRMLHLSEAERAQGVVAVSGGNHGLAVAYAARALGLDATIVMPSTTAASSIRRARADGAAVSITPTVGDAFAAAMAEVETGKVLIHPFDDPLVIAGQGTLALELHDDAPEITDVICGIGGGGMIAGVAIALHNRNPQVRIWGVETRGADAMTRSLAAAEPVTMEAITSIATTLGAPTVSARTLAAVQQLVQEVVLIDDADAVRGIEVLAEDIKLVTEPAAGATWPAALALRPRLPADAVVALVVCGGNAGLDDIAEWRQRFPA